MTAEVKRLQHEIKAAKKAVWTLGISTVLGILCIACTPLEPIMALGSEILISFLSFVVGTHIMYERIDNKYRLLLLTDMELQ
jgi:hypothetical protein